MISYQESDLIKLPTTGVVICASCSKSLGKAFAKCHFPQHNFKKMQVNFYIKKVVPATGKALIYLKFRFNKQTVMLSFKQTVEPINWNKKKQRIKSNSYTTADGKYYINDLLDSLSSTCITMYNTLSKTGYPTATAIKDALKCFLSYNLDEETKKAKVPTLYDLIDRFIAGEIKFKGNDKKYSTLKGYKTSKASLLEFERKENYKITYDSVNLDFFYKYISFLQKKGLAHNTIAKRTRTIRVFLNEAIELGFTTNAQWRSRKCKVPEKEVESVYLTDSEIFQLYNLKGLSKKLESVRDLFILGCYTGLRYSDYSNIRQENIVTIDGDVFLYVITKKTENKVIIPCNPVVLELFAKYSMNYNKLPKSISGQKFNEYIKIVAKAAGFTATGRLLTDPKKQLWECISSHTARRSAITNWYNQNALEMVHLMHISGHKSTASFIKYVKTSKLQSAQKLNDHIKNNWSKTQLKAVS